MATTQGAIEISSDEVVLGEKVGEGNFAEVYRGQCRGTLVAVKKWRSLVPEQEVINVSREIDIGGRICLHPNLVRVFGYCRSPLMLVLEFFESRELYLAVHDPSVHYSWEIVRQVAYEMACGLYHLHSNGVLHRDIKSPNILVGGNWNIKICDFGQSRLKDYELKHTRNRGTVAWSAPEVLSGGIYDQSSDIFSYGIIVWELITRGYPYGHLGDNWITIALQVQRGARPLLPSTVPYNVNAMLQACWSADRDMRPTAEQLMAFWGNPSVLPSTKRAELVS